jgi:hypothetical protein
MVHKVRVRKFENGQSALIVAVLLVAMLAMLALTFDGANAYFKRRLAQTAADAGALAGARILCSTGSTVSAANTANQYAVVNNTALLADVVATTSMVSVTTSIDFPTTFGNVLGVSEMTARATASSGCFVPSSVNKILPIGYSCKDGVITPGDGGQKYCDVVDYDHKYIIMDSDNLAADVKCMSQGGTVDCDWNNDGLDDRLVGGERGWLDLDGHTSGAGGASQLCNWIKNGFSGGARVHNWYAASEGVSASVIDCANAIINVPVFLPVYNIIATNPGPLVYDDPSDRVFWATGSSRKYLHIISFAVFVTTCVHKNGNDRNCEVYNGFKNAGLLASSVKTVEGYFTRAFVSGVSGAPGGVFTGAYTLYLTH